MSYSDTHDDVEVPVKLVVIRQIRDALAREQIRGNNNLLTNLSVQVAGLYQRLVSKAAQDRQAKAVVTHGSPSTPHQ